MTAAAATSAPTPAERAPEAHPVPHLVAAPEADPGDADAEARAEHAVFRDAAIGAVIGVVVMVPFYAALVAFALRNQGTALAGPVLMAAGVGVLAGIFLGGWSGTLVGATALEKYEREHRPKA